MSAAPALAIRDEIHGQWSGYWLEPGSSTPVVRPRYRPTGAILLQPGEVNASEFLCLDLVLVETPSSGFVWIPLSEAGRYTYAHSLGLLRREPGWRLAIWDVHGAVRVYEAETAESISQADVARLYGAEPAERARPDRPTVQLRLRAITR